MKKLKGKKNHLNSWTWLSLQKTIRNHPQQQQKAHLTNKCSKVEGYQIKMQNSIVFLHTNNKQLEIDIKIGRLIPLHKMAGSNKMRSYLSIIIWLTYFLTAFLRGGERKRLVGKSPPSPSPSPPVCTTTTGRECIWYVLSSCANYKSSGKFGGASVGKWFFRNLGLPGRYIVHEFVAIVLHVGFPEKELRATSCMGLLLFLHLLISYFSPSTSLLSQAQGVQCNLNTS